MGHLLLVCLGYHDKTTHTWWLTLQKWISHHSGSPREMCQPLWLLGGLLSGFEAAATFTHTLTLASLCGIWRERERDLWSLFFILQENSYFRLSSSS